MRKVVRTIVALLFAVSMTSCKKEDIIKFDAQEVYFGAEGGTKDVASGGTFWWGSLREYINDDDGVAEYEKVLLDGDDETVIGLRNSWIETIFLEMPEAHYIDSHGMKITVSPNTTSNVRKCLVSVGAGFNYFSHVWVIQEAAL